MADAYEGTPRAVRSVPTFNEKRTIVNYSSPLALGLHPEETVTVDDDSDGPAEILLEMVACEPLVQCIDCRRTADKPRDSLEARDPGAVLSLGSGWSQSSIGALEYVEESFGEPVPRWAVWERMKMRRVMRRSDSL